MVSITLAIFINSNRDMNNIYVSDSRNKHAHIISINNSYPLFPMINGSQYIIAHISDMCIRVLARSILDETQFNNFKTTLPLVTKRQCIGLV